MEALPPFAWSPVPGADSYEFQVAADQNFNSPVLGRGEGSFVTKNARATLRKTLPNGRYWWRVRATTKKGDASPWSNPRSLVKSWNLVPSSQTPAPGYPFTFPTWPMTLSWAPVPYAASYMFSLASDPALANIVINNGQPLETWATNYVPVFNLLPSGTYYWNVVPVDSEGNRGTPSPVSSFTWSWPSTTTTRVTDLMVAPEMFDPQFSWDPVPGATKYEVEVNSSVDFAPGSKVCCSQLTTSTSLAPTVVFRDNTYYWRVRALDAAANAGVWNRGPDFVKTFDKVPPVDPPSIKNLHLRDNLADPGTDVDPGTPGYQTNVPILKWDSVPGASAYLVDVAPNNASICDWGGQRKLAGDDLDSVVVAARLWLEQHQAVPGRDGRRHRPLASGPQQAVLRASPREGGARRRAPGRLRRLHVPRRRHGRRLPVGRVSHRRRVHSVLQPRLPRRRRLRASRARHAHETDPAGHVEAADRSPELLRDRRQGPELQQPRRLCIHAGSGLLAAKLDQADDLSGRDDALLLGGSARGAAQRWRRRGRSAVGGSLQLPEAVAAPGTDVARGRRAAHRTARLPVELRRGCAPLPLPGRPGADVCRTDRGRHDRVDVIHALHDAPRGHDALSGGYAPTTRT